MNHHALPGFGRYLVTVKLPRNPDHDPRDKKTGACPVSPECTDATGEHHTFLLETDRLFLALARYAHVTRVERVVTVERQVPDVDYQVLCGLTGHELLLRSDLTRAALDAYSVVFEPSRKLVGDHEKAIKAAVAAALLRMAEEAQRLHEKASCACGGNMPEGVSCPSCTAGPGEEAWWLRVTALRMDPDIQTRGNED
jgi:hypothetical protein